jgi:hypothetical protein
MHRFNTLVAALAFTVLLSGLANATPALDAAGKCRDGGKFVAASLCKTAAPTGKCRDIKTKKFAKCGTAGTEPVPAKAAP